VLRIVPRTPSSNAGVLSGGKFALAQSFVSVEVASPPTPAGNRSALELLHDDGGFQRILLFERDRLSLNAILLPDEADRLVVGTIDYDRNNHRFWRISETGGEILWEVSADEVGWAELGRTSAAGLDLNFRLQVFGLHISDTEIQEHHFDRFTVCRVD
jgi:hypothetical protein